EPRRRSDASSAPRTPLEQVIAAIWADALAIPAVGLDDDFFELGGDSLGAARVVASIQDAFGLTAGATARLFERPTLADHIDTIVRHGDRQTIDDVAAAWKEIVRLSNEEVEAMHLTSKTSAATKESREATL